jgi:signal transduction histidine kinase
MVTIHLITRRPKPSPPAPHRVLVMAGGLGVAALALLASTAVTRSIAWDWDAALSGSVLFLLVLLARRFPVHLTAKVKTSVGSAPLFAAALLLPTPLAGVTAAAAVIGAETVRGAPWFVVCFAAAEVTIRVVAGAGVFHLVAGVPHLTGIGVDRALLGAALAALTMYAINGLLVDAMVAIQLRRSMLHEFWSRRWPDLPQESMLYLLGLLVAGIGASAPLALALLTVPCLVIHRSLRDAAKLRRQEALRLRDEVVAQVSHDLRNPITAIRAFAQMLRRQTSRMDVPEAKSLTEGLAEIEASANRMQSLVGDLVDVSRLEAGRPLDLNLRPCDLVALARREVSRMQQLAPQHVITVDSSLDELTGEWDSDRLERVLANLLSNAVKYSPGGGRIRVHVGRRVQAGQHLAELVVQDHGVGIPAADLPKIFERYHRGGNVAGRFAGTGLGLSGAKEIVEQHGGGLTLTSREGEGTTVTVQLPCT